MKSAKKSKIAKKAVAKIVKKSKEEAGNKNILKDKKTSQKPLVRIASGRKLLNIKAVETAFAPKEKTAVKPKAAAPKNALMVSQSQKDPDFEVKKTKIRIIGIGGGGGNIVSEIANRIKKSSFCIANTDFQALRHAPKTVTVFQFGERLTNGLGTGMDPRISEEAADEDRERIKKLMEGQDLVILVSSLGGGTGSGATPIFAQISKSLGNLTYGIFTLPFAFEGDKKNEIAKTALEKIRPYVNALTILPNERVFEVVPKTTPFVKTLSYINTVLSDSLEGLIETIYDTGIINIDFADLHTILTGNGKMAFLNTVSFKKGGETDLESFENAFISPLYPYTIDKSRGLLLNIVAQKDLKLLEVNKILTSISVKIHKDARIIFGVSNEGASPEIVKVTVLATGCSYGDGLFLAEKEIAAPPATSKEKEKIKERSREEEKTKEKETTAKEHQKNETARIIKKFDTKKTDNETGRKKPDAAAPSAPKKNIEKLSAQPVRESASPSKKETIFVKESKGDAIDKFVNDAPSKPVTANFAVVPDPNDMYQTQQSINAQFQTPVRKNALQVKKDIELEEKEMLEKEKAWEIPAFLRKHQK